MNPNLSRLQPYPFQKLSALFKGLQASPAHAPINLSIGEPKHATPAFIKQVLVENLDGLASYPATAGSEGLRCAIASWLQRRYQLDALDATKEVLPVNGTREALFSFVQAVVGSGGASKPVVAMPNPFYQIYEGAALLAGAEPYFVNTTAAQRFQPDLDAVPAAIWDRCQVLFLCSPGNPTGAILSLDFLRHALKLAERHDFVIAADECYAELYRDESAPPPSLLQAALASGHDRFERCMVFHSLSKRSSVPGLRSGFVAGDPALIKPYLLYRTYHGCAMPVPTQLASIAAWNDDAHAAANRALYREKFARVLPILAPLLDVSEPDGGFYLWPDVHRDDAEFTRDLFAAQNLTILPGSYLARATPTGNPGARRVRISLVATVPECIEAAHRLRDFVSRRSI